MVWLAIAATPLIAGLEETLILTWSGDPTQTMTVLWLEEPAENPPPRIWFELTPSDAAEDEPAVLERHVATGTREVFGLSTLEICHVMLTGLSPGRTYRFGIEPQQEVGTFRTAPARLDEPLVIAVGGDASVTPVSVKMCMAASRHDPLFVLFGGDLAYGDVKKSDDWIRFLSLWHRHMRHENRLIPLVTAVGDHEYRQDVEGRDVQERLPFLYSLFPLLRQTGYALLDFGDYASVFLLNTNIPAEIPGEQTRWLEKQLADRQHRPHLLAIYHAPAFPSHRGTNWIINNQVRENWTPLFDRYGLDVAYEAHDHSYKRTHPLRDGRVVHDGTGVLYLGDGAWGVQARHEKPAERFWWFAKTAPYNHAIITTLHGDQQRHIMIDPNGEAFDAYPEPPTLAVEFVDELETAYGQLIHPQDEPLRLRMQVVQSRPPAGPHTPFHMSTRVVLEHAQSGELRSVSRPRFSPDNLSQALTVRGLEPGSYTVRVLGQMTLSDGISQMPVRHGALPTFTIVASPSIPDEPATDAFRRGFADAQAAVGIDEDAPLAHFLSPAPFSPQEMANLQWHHGLLVVEHTGLYHFSAPGGNDMYVEIGGQPLIVSRQDGGAACLSAMVALQAGKHALRVLCRSEHLAQLRLDGPEQLSEPALTHVVHPVVTEREAEPAQGQHIHP